MSESLITKKAIAEALKETCKIKNIEKISISDITKSCGLNRQTFYYHFQDKYELLNWIYYNELFIKVIEDISFDNWSDRIYELLEIMKENKSFYINTIKNSDEYFKDYLFNITSVIFKDAIEKLDEKSKLSEEAKGFISEFYSFGICGVVLSWVKSGMNESTKSVSRHLKQLALNTEKLGYERYLLL
ncbi:dihydroxyacetone kinase transcriptional activator DhaS [Clostridium gasigenes]|uniref:dihydroxyacetone kinase transcriptional activator DhaS n=1 Tax=Clostridium gasigenes TaxID=94869 RepID=UPI001C0B64EF|nr:dihydroxyacetone kinase transcriptional activator DhaS [Clostridium gasigenes]MBU3105618.1 dihydroxyacetone kinase transcriptional activator DhaS [Clostridium gasigenes]